MKILLFLSLSIFFISCEQNLKSKDTNSNVDTKDFYSKDFDHRFVYSPAESQFEVTFPNKPEISLESTLDDATKSIEKGEMAQLQIQSEQSFLKAEFLLLKRKLDDENEMRSIIKKYAKYNGLGNIELESLKNEFGTVFKLRGFKKLQGENEEVLVTYTAEYFFNGNNIFVLYAGCPSNSYPSLSINRFYDSFKNKKL